MKNRFLKLILLVSLVLALVLSLASCDSIPFFGKENSAADEDNSQNTTSPEDSTENDSGDGDKEKHKHTFTGWITTKPANCDSEGELARVCACGFKETQSIEKTTDHNYLNNKCTICGKNEFSGDAVDVGKMDSFDYSKIPAYYGSEYVILNGNVPFFKNEEKVTESYESYGEFDSLGRCTVAQACIGKDLMPTGNRTNTSFKPTGWIQAEYSFVPGGMLYNRCHLIAWALTAETTNRQNLVTGTRYMNEAMIPFEEMTAAYIKETDNHVMYRVTPVFLGDNLLCQGVLLEAFSVEDDGDGISFNLFFYNVQPNVTIDYKTGASSATGEIPEPEVPDEYDYILNVSSKKIHTADCGSAKTISDKNKEYYSGDIEDLKKDGYTAAGCCNPT